MRDFHVFIEQQGEQIYVGKITEFEKIFLESNGRSAKTMGYLCIQLSHREYR